MSQKRANSTPSFVSTGTDRGDGQWRNGGYHQVATADNCCCLGLLVFRPPPNPIFCTHPRFEQTVAYPFVPEQAADSESCPRFRGYTFGFGVDAWDVVNALVVFVRLRNAAIAQATSGAAGPLQRGYPEQEICASALCCVSHSHNVVCECETIGALDVNGDSA